MNIRNYLDKMSFSLKPKNNNLLFFIVAIVISVFIDSQIGTVADFIPEYISSFPGILLFVGLTMFLILLSFYIIYQVKRVENLTEVKYIHFKPIYYMVFGAQIVITFTLISVIFQILIFQEYFSAFLYIIEIISHGIWIGLLGLLTRAFILWYKNFNKNVVIMIFAMAMMAYVINGVFNLMDHIFTLVEQDVIITSDYVAYFPPFSESSIGSQIYTVNSIISTIAYILTWIGSVKLLYQNLRRIGRLKFWAIMSVSLIYYNVSFLFAALGYFEPSSDENAMLYILIFSFAATISGVIFGFSFLSVARTLRKDSVVRTQLMLTAYGFLLFYITGSAVAAQAAYPPFGLISVSLIGISCYLIYSGLYSSAQIVSQDLALLRQIKESVSEQANFLGGIGTAHRNKELESKVLTIAKNLEDEIQEASEVKSSLDETEMVDYIQYVMNELNEIRTKSDNSI